MMYDYNASALGLGGVLKNADGTTSIIPSLASVHLAPTGGRGTSEFSCYNRYGVSFSNASSTIFSAESGNRTFTTHSDVYITDLNLFDRIEVALMTSTIISTRDVLPGDLAIQADPDKVRFTMHSSVRGLKIDGVEVLPEFDLELTSCLTYEQFRNRIHGASDAYAQQFGVESTALETVLTSNAQPIRGSFVSALDHTPSSTIGPRKGFMLPVKNFGAVHFGELIVKPGRRRVNMLRIEFDSSAEFWQNNVAENNFTESLESPAISPAGGSMTILSQTNNGAPSWP